MDWLKNITLNLKATGPSMVLCVYLLVVGAVGVYGDGPNTGFVVGMLAVLGPIRLGTLAQRTQEARGYNEPVFSLHVGMLIIRLTHFPMHPRNKFHPWIDYLRIGPPIYSRVNCASGHIDAA